MGHLRSRLLSAPGYPAVVQLSPPGPVQPLPGKVSSAVFCEGNETGEKNKPEADAEGQALAS